jgi:hypothetical protein
MPMPPISLTGSATEPIKKREVFRSIAEHHAAINRFLDEHNNESKPFTWAADPDKIIAAVRRGHQALVSIHSHDC